MSSGAVWVALLVLGVSACSAEHRASTGAAGAPTVGRAGAPATVASDDPCELGEPGFVWYYVDADQDQHGGSERFCGEGEPPPGTARVAGDCDDADPTKSTFAPEQFRDGIDSNCDGEDDPVVCPTDQIGTGVGRGIAACLCPWLESGAPAPEQTCADAPDLFVLLLDECMGCGPGQLLVAVGNRGGVPGTALELRFDIEAISDGRAAERAPAPVPLHRLLAPGEVVAPILLPGAWPLSSVTLDGAGGDCDGSNQALQPVHYYYECY